MLHFTWLLINRLNKTESDIFKLEISVLLLKDPPLLNIEYNFPK